MRRLWFKLIHIVCKNQDAMDEAKKMSRDGCFYKSLLIDAESQQLYDRVFRLLMTHGSAVEIGCMTADKFNQVLKAVLFDNPQLFWVNGKWNLVETMQGRYARPVYTFQREEAKLGLIQMERLTSSMTSLRNESPQRCLKAVYHWLLQHVEYGLTPTQGQNSYDALIRRRAVCKGLSKAFQLLINSQGMFCTLAEGTLDGKTRHIWNVVEIDGACYHVDVSMGYRCFDPLFPDGEKAREERCFMVGDERLFRTHRLLETQKLRLTCAKDYEEDEE